MVRSASILFCQLSKIAAYKRAINFGIYIFFCIAKLMRRASYLWLRKAAIKCETGDNTASKCLMIRYPVL